MITPRARSTAGAMTAEAALADETPADASPRDGASAEGLDDPRLAPLLAELEALTTTVEAASRRLRAGRTDQVSADASAISERAGALDAAAHPVLATLASEAAAPARAALADPAARLQAALARHTRLVASLQGAARALADQAKREHVKRAGGGLYSPEGGAAGRVAASGGRLLGQL